MISGGLNRGEKSMRKSLLGFGLGALLMAGAASAAPVGTVPTGTAPGLTDGDFTVTIDLTPGQGALTGFDIYRYFAKFTPTSATGLTASGLQSVKTTLDVLAAPGDTATPVPANANLRFKFVDQDFDDVPDADITGASITDTAGRTNNTTIGTFIRVNPSGSFAAQSVSPGGARSDPDSNGTPDFDPSVTYAAVKSFRVEGFEKNPPDGPGFDSSAETTSTTGALFAVAIVPSGRGVRAQGQLAADKGVTVFFDTVPEPTSLGLIGLGGAALLGRRRRK